MYSIARQWFQIQVNGEGKELIGMTAKHDEANLAPKLRNTCGMSCSCSWLVLSASGHACAGKCFVKQNFGLGPTRGNSRAVSKKGGFDKCTLVPVFGTGEHPNVPLFWLLVPVEHPNVPSFRFSVQGTPAKTTLWATAPLATTLWQNPPNLSRV